MCLNVSINMKTNCTSTTYCSIIEISKTRQKLVSSWIWSLIKVFHSTAFNVVSNENIITHFNRCLWQNRSIEPSAAVLIASAVFRRQLEVSDNLSKSQWQYTEANALLSHTICQYASICLRLSRSLGLSLLSLVTKWIRNRRPSFLFILLFRWYNIMIMTTIDSDPELIFRQKTIMNLLKGYRQYCLRSAFCACHGLTAESSDARGRVLYNGPVPPSFQST